MNDDMRTSEAGLKFIMEREGVRLEAYPDPATGDAPWTIGVGHTGGVSPGDSCTRQQAMAWLREDVSACEQAILRNVRVKLTQNMFDALVSFTFNVGTGAFAGSTLLRLLNAGRFRDAEQQFARWNRANGCVLAGLVTRRRLEAELFERSDEA